MKKPVPLLLCLTFALVGFQACEKRADLSLRLEMEKMSFEAGRLKRQLSLKGPQLSDEDLQLLVNTYTAITEKARMPDDSVEVRNASREKREIWALALSAIMNIGLLYQEADDYEGACHYFERVSIDPSVTAAERNYVIGLMAGAREKSGQYEEAANLYRTYADGYLKILDPEKPDLVSLNAPLMAAEMWSRLGNADRYTEEIDRAQKYYNQLLREYPNTPLEDGALGKLIASYLNQKRYKEAIDILESKRDRQSGLLDPELLLLMADIYERKLADFESAERTYREFISCYPESGRLGVVYLGTARNLYAQGKYGEARRFLKEIHDIPDLSSETAASAYFLTALCYEKEGNWESAVSQFNILQAAFPGSGRSFESGLYVANHYKYNGETEAAQRSFAEAEDYIRQYTDPSTAGAPLASLAFTYLARCYVDQGDTQRAIETLTALHDRYPRRPEGRSALLSLAGLYVDALADTTSAVYWYKTYVEENPRAVNLNEIQARIQTLKPNLQNEPKMP